MSAFDLVFALFGLVLGLAMTEVLAGFGRVLKMRRRARVGWLTPLLGAQLLIELTRFWIGAYTQRDNVHVNLLTLLIVLGFVGSYYLIATLVFPDDPAEWPDFDDYYDRHKRQVVGGMLALNLAAFAAYNVAAMLGAKPPQGEQGGAYMWVSAIAFFGQVPVMAVLWAVRGRRLNLALLVLLIASWLVAAVAWVL